MLVYTECILTGDLLKKSPDPISILYDRLGKCMRVAPRRLNPKIVQNQLYVEFIHALTQCIPSKRKEFKKYMRETLEHTVVTSTRPETLILHSVKDCIRFFDTNYLQKQMLKELGSKTNKIRGTNSQIEWLTEELEFILKTREGVVFDTQLLLSQAVNYSPTNHTDFIDRRKGVYPESFSSFKELRL